MARDETVQTVNKYGKTVTLPPTGTTGPVRQIIGVLNSLGVECVPEFYFNVTGYRRQKFDVGVLKDGEIRLLIEFDGPAHYDPAFYAATGVRECRCMAHVVKAQISEAKKQQTANHFGVPLLRVNEKHLPYLRSLLVSYITVFIDGVSTSNTEVIMTDMFDKYGWEIPFVPCSDPTREEQEAYERHNALAKKQGVPT